MTFPTSPRVQNALALGLAALLVAGCGDATTEPPIDPARVPTDSLPSNRPFNTPDWAKTASIYELNVRQFTPEGTFAAVRPHLPRLAEMGVDVVWFMPIYPISETKRKGSMGSYYASADFNAVNPEFGTMAEFEALVEEIRALGMHVILDWTANHTGWDHPWIEDHPEYYVRRAGTDTIRHAFNPNDTSGGDTDWYDIAQLDYGNPAVTPAMIEQMRFWLENTGVEGFRCDVAGFVPVEFWYAARPELERVKPIFMLAEWGDEPRHFEAAFDINYGWAFHQLLNRIAEGEEDDPVQAVWDYQARDTSEFAPYAYHLNFTTNHDENSWNGTEFERMGDLADAMWVVCATLEGTPLVYSGQEEPLRRRLAFFEKDDIGFGAFAKTKLFAPLLHLKDRNRALRNGTAGARARRIELPSDATGVLAFERERAGDRVGVFANLGGDSVELPVDADWQLDDLRDVYAAGGAPPKPGAALTLQPGGYRVFTTE